MQSFLKSMALGFVLSGLLALPTNADSFHNNTTIITPFPFYATSSCLPGNVSVCGKLVPTPGGPLGSLATMTVPSPYMHQPFTAQCVITNGVPAYLITDTSAINCTLMSCPASNVSVCGVTIPVPTSMTVGGEVPVNVPRSLLVAGATNVSFTAQCVDNGSDTGVYQVKNALGFSCDQFPCQDDRVSLCGTEIPVPGGTRLGGVIQMTMPKPFKPEIFSVQCVGTLGQPPAYQLMDHSGISCEMQP